MKKDELGFKLREYRKIKNKNPNEFFGTLFRRDEGQILIKLADGEKIPILIDFERKTVFIIKPDNSSYISSEED